MEPPRKDRGARDASRLPVPLAAEKQQQQQQHRKRQAPPSENDPPRPAPKRPRAGPPAQPRIHRAALAAAAPPQQLQPKAAPWKPRGAGGDPARPPPPPASKAAAPAPARGEKKRAPWDLKGQLSDERAKAAAYREKIQGLSGEARALAEQLEACRWELQQATARNTELDSQGRTLSMELQTSRAQGEEDRRRIAELLGKSQQLEKETEDQARRVEALAEAAQQMEEANRDLLARLEAAQKSLQLAEGSLAQQAQENGTLRARKAELEQKLHESEMERRSLHNAVQELKGNIRVFCRVRPLLPCEKEAKKATAHLRFPSGDSKSLVLSKAEESHVGRERKEDVSYEFSFDRVFPPPSSQEEVFEEIALLVQSALDGYNVCIFAYGQTGSGKTYTMEGPDGLTADSAGMIPRAVEQIFRAAREMEAKGWTYQFTASFLEIYNESLRDLLVLHPERSSELEIRRVSQCSEELHVPNLSYVPVASAQQVLKLLQQAKAQRSVSKTTLNERSSRSHSLFQLRVEGHNARRELRTCSTLSLVDLAGSERLDKSLSTGERLRETQAINSSLSTLGLVIMALSNKEPHVPYRNSKLTYLLQNSLGGQAKMLMFVNISPLEENLSETLNSLRFARKVNECVIGTAVRR